jgi:hypothetical protein
LVSSFYCLHAFPFSAALHVQQTQHILEFWRIYRQSKS